MENCRVQGHAHPAASLPLGPSGPLLVPELTPALIVKSGPHFYHNLSPPVLGTLQAS